MRAGVITRSGVLDLRRMRRRLTLLASLSSLLMLAGAAAANAATLRVNTTGDPALPSAKCSLREAVETANSPGTKTSCGSAGTFFNYIVLQAKTYQLKIPPGSQDNVDNCVNPSTITPPPDQNATGDLCIHTNIGLTIVGKGPTTIIEGQPGLDDRLMTIGPEASVALVALDMEGGRAPAGAGGAVSCALGANTDEDGGAIYNTGSLSTNVVTIEANAAGAGDAGDNATGANGCAGGSGGGIYNDHSAKTTTSPAFPGALTLTNTMFIGNATGAGGAGGSPSGSLAGGTGGTGGSGGALYNSGGSVLVSNSTFLLDKAGIGGQGGVGGSGGGNGGTGGDGSPGGGVFSTGGSLSVTNSTFSTNSAGAGGHGGKGAGGGNGGNGGDGANGGAVAVVNGASGLLNATVATNGFGSGGTGGNGKSPGNKGTDGTAGGIFAQSSTSTDDLRLQNSIVASSAGLNCLGSPSSAIADGGHNLSFGDKTCPAVTNGDPKLSGLPVLYGGYTLTLALGPGSAAINKVPKAGASCPATDQRTVKRPQGPECDIGAFEFARPKVEIDTPRNGGKYKRGSRVMAFFVCSEGGITDPQITPIASCKGTVANGKRINTSTLGGKSFTVTAKDKAGTKTTKSVHYRVIR